MIADFIANAAPRMLLRREAAFEQAFEWIEKESQQVSDGIVELDGRSLYVNVHRYTTMPRSGCRWESHRRTVDLQYIMEGEELVDWTSEQPAGDSTYDDVKDVEFWPGAVAQQGTLHLAAGMYAVFFPGELHRPMIMNEDHAPIRKLVVKIRSDLLNILR